MSFYQACVPFIALLLWLNDVKWIKWPKPTKHQTEYICIDLKLFDIRFDSETQRIHATNMTTLSTNDSFSVPAEASQNRLLQGNKATGKSSSFISKPHSHRTFSIIVDNGTENRCSCSTWRSLGRCPPFQLYNLHLSSTPTLPQKHHAMCYSQPGHH